MRRRHEQRYFPLLPPELRLKIWKLSLPSTRLVSIRCGADLSLPCDDACCDAEGARPVEVSFTGCTSTVPPPSSLHACSESRAEALKVYSGAFGFGRRRGHIMFNPDSDIVYFGPRKGYMAAEAQLHTCMAMCDPAELACVRRVAISDALFWIDDTYRSLTASTLTVQVLKQLALRLPALEELMFIPRERDAAVDPRGTEDRMTRQVQTAMQTLWREYPWFTPPPWSVVSLQSLIQACD